MNIGEATLMSGFKINCMIKMLTKVKISIEINIERIDYKIVCSFYFYVCIKKFL